MMNAGTNAKDDIPPLLAISLMALILGGLCYFAAPDVLMLHLKRWDLYLSTHSVFVFFLVSALSINVVAIYSFLSRSLGINRQGRRLEILTGKHNERNETKRPMGIALTVGGAVAVLVFSIVGSGVLDLTPEWLNGNLYRAFVLAATLNLAMAAAVAAHMLQGLVGSSDKERVVTLPVFPRFKNTIVLGSSNEETAGEAAKWETLSKTALVGNILITGSIGGGKTQGTILPYLEQALTNFDPRPSVLAIDPKSTFLRKAKELVEEKGFSNDVLHMKLGGDVKFNPIFFEGTLKDAKFLEIAQMLRAAGSNFLSDRGQNADFWEVKSYDLMKACLIHCAVTKDYYTMTDLYTSIVKAVQESVVDELKDAIKEGTYDVEETFNIKRAIEYFEEEYQQLDDKIRTSILTTATSFLNQFQEYQAHSTFCPAKIDRTINSMNEVVDGGKIFLFDITNPALARSTGTLIKLLYQQSVLDRLKFPERGLTRPALLIIDEYQDVVTVGGAGSIGDVGYLAKGREAGAITIAASQSHISIENAVGRERAAKELIQNFRTRIIGHSTDLATIRSYQELVGKQEVKLTSHSVSETSQHTSRNLMAGGFEGKDANISESLSTSEHKEYVLTGKEFSSLNTFESFALVFDGVSTQFKKLFLKPFFLKDKAVPHSQVLQMLRTATAAVAFLIAIPSFAFPNICSVVKTAEFRSCLGMSVGGCMCGFPPRPCAQISYYVPQTFIEVMPDPKDTHFGGLPVAASQLATAGSSIPFGHEADDDTQSYQAHTLAVPLTQIPFSMLPCGGARMDRFCFDGMSEHLGSNWNTGKADSLQPNFLAWSLSPKACLIKGAIQSATGGETVVAGGSPVCSTPMGYMPKYPPSSHSACNGWGTFYPRYGSVHGPSQTIGALMIASRMKSISSEVIGSTPSTVDELWQMISPQSSSCFREGQNTGLLETIKNVRELGRLKNGEFKGHLFTVWSKVSCCRDVSEVASAYVAIEAINAACAGIGAL